MLENRLDIDQSEKNRKLASSKPNEKDNSCCFDYEAHIFFDDAISYQLSGDSEPNMFVKNMIRIVEEAAM